MAILLERDVTGVTIIHRETAHLLLDWLLMPRRREEYKRNNRLDAFRG